MFLGEHVWIFYSSNLEIILHSRNSWYIHMMCGGDICAHEVINFFEVCEIFRNFHKEIYLHHAI